LYSRLVHTLENACNKRGTGGREALAEHLSALRQNGNEPEKELPAQAFSRLFRRLGYTEASTDACRYARNLSKKVGEAVSRPGEQVLQMLAMFCAGDEALRLKPVCGATPVCFDCLLTRECDFFNNPRVPAMSLMPPTARLLSGNGQAVSDAELLSVILYGDKATGREAVVETMLARYGRLRAAFRAEPEEYSSIRGMTKPQAIRLAAINALHRRLLAERRGEMLRITSAKDIHDRYAVELRDYQTEAAVMLMLDQQNSIIRDVWFCDTSPTANFVTIADLLRPAIREFAVRIALVHNHPSDNPSPSMDDMDFTRRLRAACDIVGIGLLDHVIVTESGYYSFMESGNLGM
jgi:DNA repair proteins